MSTASYLSYFMLVAIMVFTPGPMTLFLMSNGINQQTRNSVPLLLGANHAYLISIIIFSIGLADLLNQFPFLLKSCQIAGILYLFYLFKTQWHKQAMSLTAMTDTQPIPRAKLYAKGALVAFSNPKTLLLFSIIIPQFAVRNDDYYYQVAALGVTFLILQFFSGCFYLFLGRLIKNILQHDTYQLLINRISALILLGIAIFLIGRL